MKITVTTTAGTTLTAKLPYKGATFAVIAHGCTDSSCDNRPQEEDPGMTVKPSKTKIVERDTVEGDALCNVCEAPIGRITVKFSTIFGIEEDARVLSGRYGRVY